MAKPLKRTILSLVALSAPIIFAGPAHAQTVPGTALSFDGIDDYVQISGFLNAAPTLEVTVEFWQQANVAAAQSTFAESVFVNGSIFNAHVPYSDGNVYWDFGDIFNGGRLSYQPPESIVGTWQHFALVASQSGNYMRIYRNGVLEASKTGMTPLVQANLDLDLSGFPAGVPFGGLLDEFRIWNVARTPEEIRANMSRLLSGLEPNLVAYWRFDEGGGSTVADASGQGRTGTLFNGPSWVTSTVPLISDAITQPPTAITATSALLNGLAYPRDPAALAWFEWGATASYGNRTPVTSLGIATEAISVRLALTNLTAASVYNYRLVVSNSLDVFPGMNQSFSTCAPIPSGLVSWWPAEWTANDRIGTNPGTLMNGASFDAGEVGIAFSFDGVDDVLQIGAAPIPPPWSAEFWINRQDSLDDSAILVGDANTALKLEQWPNTRQVGFTQFGVADYAFDYIAPIGAWVHLVFVGTASDTQLYVNGTLQGTQPASIALPLGQIAGDIPGRFANQLKGLVDEASIYNRALTASQIQALYNSGASGKCIAPPVNDCFCNRTLIEGTNLLVTGSNRGATSDVGEPRLSPNAAGQSIWWSWSTTNSGRVFLSTLDANFDTVLGVYQGSSLSALTTVAVNDDRLSPFYLFSAVSFDAVVPLKCAPKPCRESYQIVVDGSTKPPILGYHQSAGEVSVKLSFVPRPPNDDFAHRIPLSGAYVIANGSIPAATPEPGEPILDGTNGLRTMWWSWTAPTNLGATVAGATLIVHGAGFLPAIGVYQGNSVSTLTNGLATNISPTNFDLTSQLNFDAVAGQTYQIAVAGPIGVGMGLGSTFVDDVSLDHTNQSGDFRLELNFSTVALRLINLTRSRTNFTGQARVQNFGSASVGPLRIRLVTVSPATIDTMGGFPLPSPGLVVPGGNALVEISGTVPFYSLTRGLDVTNRIEVYALLEQAVETSWFVLDSGYVLPGNALVPFPDAGPIPIFPGLPAFGLCPYTLLSVAINGPATVCQGNAAQYYGTATFTNNCETKISVNFTNTLWKSSLFSISSDGILSGCNVTSNTPVRLTFYYAYRGVTNSATRLITVQPCSGPCPVLTNWVKLSDGSLQFALRGSSNVQYVVEAASDLGPPIAWVALATNLTSPTGISNFRDRATNFSQRFYRSRQAQ